ncbi:MAG: hypothetical protein R6V56_08805 [Lentisphaeria bacterium]
MPERIALVVLSWRWCALVSVCPGYGRWRRWQEADGDVGSTESVPASRSSDVPSELLRVVLSESRWLCSAGAGVRLFPFARGHGRWRRWQEADGDVGSTESVPVLYVAPTFVGVVAGCLGESRWLCSAGAGLRLFSFARGA